MKERGLRLIASAIVMLAGAVLLFHHEAEPFGVLLLGMAGLFFLRDWFAGYLAERERHVRRYQEGICRKCGYNLTGNVSGICLECGQRIG